MKDEEQKEEEEKEFVRLEGRAGEEELRGWRWKRGRAWTWTLGVASERALKAPTQLSFLPPYKEHLLQK